MIAGVTGKLVSKASDSVVIDIGGISLRLFAPASTLNHLADVGKVVQLQTHLAVREDSLTLYGFLTAEELNAFDMLLTVSGVGPKLALAILSSASVDTLRLALASGNADGLTAIPGIGRKLAGRLVLELRGKIDPRSVPTTLGSVSLDGEVIEALTSLGFSPGDVQAAIQSIPDSSALDLEERIRQTLQYFSRRQN